MTIAACPLLAVAFRTQVLPLKFCSQNWRGRIAYALELGSAVMVLMLGMVPLFRL